MSFSEIPAPERIDVDSPEGSYAIYIGEKIKEKDPAGNLVHLLWTPK